MKNVPIGFCLNCRRSAGKLHSDLLEITQEELQWMSEIGEKPLHSYTSTQNCLFPVLAQCCLSWLLCSVADTVSGVKATQGHPVNLFANNWWFRSRFGYQRVPRWLVGAASRACRRANGSFCRYLHLQNVWVLFTVAQRDGRWSSPEPSPRRWVGQERPCRWLGPPLPQSKTAGGEQKHSS